MHASAPCVYTHQESQTSHSHRKFFNPLSPRGLTNTAEEFLEVLRTSELQSVPRECDQIPLSSSLGRGLGGRVRMHA